MRPPHLDHVGVFGAQALQRAAKLSRRRKHMILRRDQRRNVHRRWERIVGALGFVHVVVGVHELFAQQRVGARGDNLVDVHVALRAAARLPDNKRELVRQSARQNLVAGLGNQSGTFVIHFAETVVGHSGGLF